MATIFTSDVRPRAGRTGYELLGTTYRPSFGDVLSAGFDAGLSGEGSAIQDVAATEVARELGREQELGVVQGFSNLLNTGLFGALSPDSDPSAPQSSPLTEDEWKQSPFYREDLSYQPGMTTRAAQILATTRDRAADREFVLSKSEGFLQGAGFIAGGFAGAMADAKNVAVTVGVAAATPLVVGGLTAGPVGAAAGGVTAGGAGLLAGAARFGTAITRLNSAGVATLKASRMARLGTVLGEAVISTVPSVATGLQNAPIIQQEYDAQDAAFDLLASVGLSAGLQGVGEALGAAWRRRAKVDDTLEVAQVATQQVVNGERLDVQPLIQEKLSDYVPEVTNVDFAPRFVQEGGSGRKIRYRAEQEVFGEVIASRPNNTKAGAEAELKERFLSRSVQVARDLNLPPQDIARIEAVATLRAQLKTFDGERLADEMVERSPAVTQARQKVEAAEQALEAAKPSKRQSRSRGVEDARRRLEVVRQQERPLMLQAAAREREKIRQTIADGEATIRDVQRRAAAVRMPEYAKAQLDNSVEGKAARSIDPKAAEIAAEGVPPVRFDPEEVPVAPADSDMQLVRELAEREPAFRAALEEAEGLDAAPDAIRQFIKCRAGR